VNLPKKSQPGVWACSAECKNTGSNPSNTNGGVDTPLPLMELKSDAVIERLYKSNNKFDINIIIILLSESLILWYFAKIQRPYLNHYIISIIFELKKYIFCGIQNLKKCHYVEGRKNNISLQYIIVYYWYQSSNYIRNRYIWYKL